MIQIYCDNGANIRFLKKLYPHCLIYQRFPYDTISETQKNKQLPLGVVPAIPSAVSWQHAHITWEEFNNTWESCHKTDMYDTFAKIIGRGNPEDILHVDSAYKSGCRIFLTSDKTDIYSKKSELELICGFKFFFHTDEQQIIECIETLLHQIYLKNEQEKV